MSVPEFFEWTVAQNLAYRIVDGLYGYSKVIEDRAAKHIQVTGDLPLGDAGFTTKKNARCIFEAGPHWVTSVPKVVCLEPWIIRKLPEWHIGEDGSVCFEFDLNWEHELTSMVEQLAHGLTADYACAWLLNSTRSLLQRHLFASRSRLAAWPKGWEYWAHTREAANCQLMTQLERQSHASAV